MRAETWIVSIVLAFGIACGGTKPPPKDLVDARAAYAKAQAGPASDLTPAQLHEAKKALDKAEEAFRNEPEEPETADLAYVAQRKAQWADSQAGIQQANRQREQAQKDLDSAQKSELANVRGEAARTRAELNKTQGELGKTREQLAEEQKRLEAERRAREAAEKKLQEAMLTLQKIASVKDESRGLVITFQGAVLFKSSESTLMAGAMLKLDQVAEQLRETERAMVVEGHTDNLGGAGYNISLSEKRANAVRDYLITKGIPADRIKAVGIGQARPIAENTSAEGRASNRRVEIIVEPKK